jgi:hypothetical protein
VVGVRGRQVGNRVAAERTESSRDDIEASQIRMLDSVWTSTGATVRDTVFLATVLFLAGISGHFSPRTARYDLVTAGALLLILAVVQLLGLPGPPP